MHSLLRTVARLTQYVSYKNLKNLTSNSSCPYFNSLMKLQSPNSYTKCVATRLYCSNKNEDSPVQENAEENEVDIDAIANGSEEIAHKMKVILLEMEVMRQEGRCVPPNEFMKPQHWQELLRMQAVSGRRRYLEFLFKTHMKRKNAKAKQEEGKIQRAERLKEKPPVTTFEEFVKTYDLQHNNIFLRFYETTMNQMYNNRLIQAIQFGQKIVIDCGYNDHMTRRESINCAKQFMLLFAENRVHEDPYDIHFCNANPETHLMQALHRHIPTMYEPWFPMSIHQQSYLDLFPKEQLVYLTPHCREELTEYDHDAVYIIGGIVDKINNEPVSLAKAKRERLKMAKLPLDRYLSWSSGSGKSLTLNQMVSIMLDMKRTGDWNYALKHVPRRKLEMKRMESHSQDHQMNRSSRPDRQQQSSWSPSYNADFGNDTFNSRRKSNNQTNKDSFLKALEKRKRLTNVRSIMYDED